jgi:hypothetical protein
MATYAPGSEETRKMWDFPFRLVMTLVLGKDHLIQELKCENTGLSHKTSLGTIMTIICKTWATGKQHSDPECSMSQPNERDERSKIDTFAAFYFFRCYQMYGRYFRLGSPHYWQDIL